MKKSKNNKNNFYYGTVCELRNIGRDGIKSVMLGLYDTIAYRDKNGTYYDFLSQEEMEELNVCEFDRNVLNNRYFLKEKPYFKKAPVILTANQKEELYADIFELSKQPSFKKPGSVRVRD